MIPLKVETGERLWILSFMRFGENSLEKTSNEEQLRNVLYRMYHVESKKNKKYYDKMPVNKFVDLVLQNNLALQEESLSGIYLNQVIQIN